MPSNSSTRLPPLREVLKDVQASTRIQASTQPMLPVALIDAIDIVDEKLLRTLVKQYCETFAPLRQKLEDRLLVKGHDIVRYDSSDEDKNIGEDIAGSVGKSETGVIPVANEELTSRYATCSNCKTKFDITQNRRGDCRWHTGRKECYDDDDFWADHDEDCHGRVDDLMDEPEFAEGFKWSCCDALGDDVGCKSTKHKAEVNIIGKALKRKAEDKLLRPARKSCQPFRV